MQNGEIMFNKLSIVRKLSNGNFRVYRNGRNMGTYLLKEAAEERSKKVDCFNENDLLIKIVSLAKDLRSVDEKGLSKELLIIAGAGDKADLSYSAVMRELRQDDDKDRTKVFMTVFKEIFDQSFISELEEPQNIALMQALKAIDYEEE